MAHEIFIDEGRASMMYAGTPPWHKLGTQVPADATAAEAIEAANLNWRVTKLPLYASNGIHGIRVQDKYGLVREDWIPSQDCPIYGVVSDSYRLLQNADAFAFFDTIVKDKNAAIYHTAGALGRGERIWILAKLPGHIRVVGDDVTHKYLLLSNSHDGRSSVQIKFTPVRVVCQNTLSWALSSGETLSIRHGRNLEQRLRDADQMLGIINKSYQDIETTYVQMAKTSLNSDLLTTYLSSVFPDPADKEDFDGIRKAKRNRDFAEHFFTAGKGNDMPAVQGSLWAAYNGVTELIDHKISYGKSPGGIGDSRRLNSMWFGEGNYTKLRAYKAAVDLMRNN